MWTLNFHEHLFLFIYLITLIAVVLNLLYSLKQFMSNFREYKYVYLYWIKRSLTNWLPEAITLIGTYKALQAIFMYNSGLTDYTNCWVIKFEHNINNSLPVCQGLAGRHHNTLSSVDTQRIHILHVANLAGSSYYYPFRKQKNSCSHFVRYKRIQKISYFILHSNILRHK